MATTAETIRIDSAGAASLLQQASEQLKRAQGEVLVDFSSVRRIDPRALRLLEEVAAEADKRQTKVRLRGVNVDVYKVMKLAQLASRFTFQH